MHYPKLLSALCLVLFLVSCSNDSEESTFEFEEITSEKYLDTYVKNPIIFQKTYVNENSETVRGQFITKTGELHNFEINKDEFEKDEIVFEDYIYKILNSSTEMVEQVNLDKLREFYRFNLLSGRTHPVSISPADQENTNQIILSSYILRTTYTTWDNPNVECPVHHDWDSVTKAYVNATLKTTGSVNSINTGTHVNRIVSWLEQTFVDEDISTSN